MKQTEPWGSAEHMETEDDIAVQVDVALEDGDL